MTPAEADAIVYERLCIAAEHDAPCPSNKSMAELIPDGSEYIIKRTLKRLVKAGRITVLKKTQLHVRKVRINGAGLETAWSRRRTDNAVAEPHREPEDLTETVDPFPPNCFAAHNITAKFKMVMP